MEKVDFVFIIMKKAFQYCDTDAFFIRKSSQIDTIKSSMIYNDSFVP